MAHVRSGLVLFHQWSREQIRHVLDVVAQAEAAAMITEGQENQTDPYRVSARIHDRWSAAS